MAITDRPTRMVVTPVSPTLGAEITRVDLASIDDSTWREIEQAWAEHAVLFFRDQDLSPEAHEALGRRIGDLHVHPAAPTVEGHPHVMIIHADEKSRVVAGNGWHTDVSCDERPPAATILHMRVVPQTGGDTLFASTEAAYGALSEPMKDFLVDKIAVHESAHYYRDRYGTMESESRDGQFPTAEHPVVRTHPVTRRKSIYVNRTFTTRIKGLAANESQAVLTMLCDHIEHRPEFQIRFRWTPGAVALWDNRCTQHYAAWDYYPQVRSGRRVSVVGERPF
jgi:taurine dioxygenase